MKASELHPGAYLAAKDGGWPRLFTIERFEEHNKVGDDIKPAIYFREEERGLIINKTVTNQIAVMYGDETDDWIGKQIVVYVDNNVTYGGKPTPALRVRKPKQAAKPAPPPEPDPVRDDMDDDIPF